MSDDQVSKLLSLSDDLIKISTEIKLYSKDTGLNVSSFTEAFGNYAKDVSSDLAAYEESSPVVKELPVIVKKLVATGEKGLIGYLDSIVKF